VASGTVAKVFSRVQVASFADQVKEVPLPSKEEILLNTRFRKKRE
jgi:hypothetical protein